MHKITKEDLDEKIRQDSELMEKIPRLLKSLKILKESNGSCFEPISLKCRQCPFKNFSCGDGGIKISNSDIREGNYDYVDMLIWKKNRKITKEYLKELL